MSLPEALLNEEETEFFTLSASLLRPSRASDLSSYF
jgi:hypothetical protein